MALGIIVAATLGYYCFKDYLRFKREELAQNKEYLKMQQKDQEFRHNR